MKLYLLKKNGIVKIGITKEEDVSIRLKNINQHLSEENKFELVTDFEMNSSPALIEKLIHHYLGANKLNLAYLHDNMLIVDLECIINKTSGYTETFLSDTEKVKGIITLFGLCGYINLSPDKLKKLNYIDGTSFDNLIKDFPRFKKMLNLGKNTFDYSCINSLDNLQTITSLKEISESIKDNKINISFSVINKDFYVLFNDKKIKCDDLVKFNNENYLYDISNHKYNLFYDIKPVKELYELQENYAKENDLKSKSISLYKEINKENREEDLKQFIKQNKKLLEDFLEDLCSPDYLYLIEDDSWNSSFYIGYDILNYFFKGNNKSSLTNLIYTLNQVFECNNKKFLDNYDSLQKTLNSDNLFKIDWDKDDICPNLSNVTNKIFSYAKLSNLEKHIKDNSLILSSNIIKELYFSNNKKQTIQDIKILLDLTSIYMGYTKFKPKNIYNKKYNKDTAKHYLINLSKDNKQYVNIVNSAIEIYSTDICNNKYYDNKIDLKYYTKKEKKKFNLS